MTVYQASSPSSYKPPADGMASLSMRLLPALAIQQPSGTVFSIENGRLTSNDEHLVDKTSVDRHAITPYKYQYPDSAARASFIYVHSTTRAQID